MQSFEIETELGLGAKECWAHMTNPSGVNAEFWPFLRMTFPSAARGVTSGWQPGRRLFRSWILLFGVLPVKYDDCGFEQVDVGTRFLETSKILSPQECIHDPEIKETLAGLRLIDQVSFVSKLAFLERIHLAVFRFVFRYRHFRLRRL